MPLTDISQAASSSHSYYYIKHRFNFSAQFAASVCVATLHLHVMIHIYRLFIPAFMPPRTEVLIPVLPR